jgi:hypothetical protein
MGKPKTRVTLIAKGIQTNSSRNKATIFPPLLAQIQISQLAVGAAINNCIAHSRLAHDQFTYVLFHSALGNKIVNSDVVLLPDAVNTIRSLDEITRGPRQLEKRTRPALDIP